MPVIDPLCEGVTVLLRAAADFLPARGLGVVRSAGAEHLVLTYVDAFGATAYHARREELPEPVRPRRAGLLRLTAAEFEANPGGLAETRLLHIGFPDDIRQELAVRQILTLPVPDAEEPTLLVVAIGDASALTPAQLSLVDQLARRVVAFLHRAQSPR